MLAVSACASNPPPEPVPPPVGNAVVSSARRADAADTAADDAAPTGPAAGSKGDFAAKSTDRVYFDYDQYNLDDADRRSLATQVSPG
jgi:peptidoglycan-associated lipoprotein